MVSYKFGMAKNQFNNEVILPKKLRKRLRRMILMYPSMVRDIPNDFDDFEVTSQRPPMNNALTDLYIKIDECRTKMLKGRIGPEDFDDFVQKQERENIGLIDNTEKLIIDFFSGLLLSQEEIVSSRERRDFVNRNRQCAIDGLDPIEWNTISLRPYLNDFIRWIVKPYDNSLPPWPSEDWKSDTLYIMRGYFIAKNQRKGFSLNAVKDVDDAMECAKPFIPKEGLEVTQQALELSRVQLPSNSKWREKGTLHHLDLANGNRPKIDIIQMDDDYILIHLKNESAAQTFGAKTAWCTARGMFDEYADNLLYLCDAEGNRYQLSFTQGQIMDEADEAYPYAQLKARYDGLAAHIAQFYSDALDAEINKFKTSYEGKGRANPYDKSIIKPLTSGIDNGMDLTAEDVQEIIMGYTPTQIIDAIKVLYATRISESVSRFIQLYDDMDDTRQYLINSGLVEWHLDEHLNGEMDKMKVSGRAYEVEVLLIEMMVREYPERIQKILQRLIEGADQMGNTNFIDDIEKMNAENDWGLDLDFTIYGNEIELDDDMGLLPDELDRLDALSKHAEGHVHPRRRGGPA
jgi:hypothetical protein